MSSRCCFASTGDIIFETNEKRNKRNSFAGEAVPFEWVSPPPNLRCGVSLPCNGWASTTGEMHAAMHLAVHGWWTVRWRAASSQCKVIQSRCDPASSHRNIIVVWRVRHAPEPVLEQVRGLSGTLMHFLGAVSTPRADCPSGQRSAAPFYLALRLFYAIGTVGMTNRLENVGLRPRRKTGEGKSTRLEHAHHRHQPRRDNSRLIDTSPTRRLPPKDNSGDGPQIARRQQNSPGLLLAKNNLSPPRHRQIYQHCGKRLRQTQAKSLAKMVPMARI